jgi:hypothetical protein
MIFYIFEIPPYSSARWTKYASGGNPVTINISNTSKYSGSVIGNPSLTIRSADLSDKATYVCTGTNSVGTGTRHDPIISKLYINKTINGAPKILLIYC